jgi:hypothetical protein
MFVRRASESEVLVGGQARILVLCGTAVPHLWKVLFSHGCKGLQCGGETILRNFVTQREEGSGSWDVHISLKAVHHSSFCLRGAFGSLRITLRICLSPEAGPSKNHTGFLSTRQGPSLKSKNKKGNWIVDNLGMSALKYL